MKVEGIELGKKLGTSVVPEGRKSFSISRYEKGIVLKKQGQIIVLSDSFMIQILEESIMRFWKQKSEGEGK